jgi:hypothetical protein
VPKIHSFDFEYDHDYTLIGIHSALEDYRLAYFLNKNLDLHLVRFKDDLDFPSLNCRFSLFKCEDEVTFTSWSLISNRHVTVSDVVPSNNNLFGEETKVYHLINEKKMIDYFIKINGVLSHDELQNIIIKLKNTVKIITSYEVNPNDLLSKDYLIF